MKVHPALWRSTLVMGVALICIQFVPFGRSHANPPSAGEPAWDSPQTRELAQRACFDCHSNETRWPWYSHVAPMSWLVQYDVDEGRAKLNLSEWTRPQDEAEEAADALIKGEMPLKPYVWLHSSARLDEAERQALARGLAATFGPPSEGGDDDDEGEDERPDSARGERRAR